MSHWYLQACFKPSERGPFFSSMWLVFLPNCSLLLRLEQKLQARPLTFFFPGGKKKNLFFFPKNCFSYFSSSLLTTRGVKFSTTYRLTCGSHTHTHTYSTWVPFNNQMSAFNSLIRRESAWRHASAYAIHMPSTGLCWNTVVDMVHFPVCQKM